MEPRKFTKFNNWMSETKWDEYRRDIESLLIKGDSAYRYNVNPLHLNEEVDNLDYYKKNDYKSLVLDRDRLYSIDDG